VQLTREILIRHPNRCTHNAVCIPVCRIVEPVCARALRGGNGAGHAMAERYVALPRLWRGGESVKLGSGG